jgi:hypothetical protein
MYRLTIGSSDRSHAISNSALAELDDFGAIDDVRLI